jgi:hypothetical protein
VSGTRWCVTHVQALHRCPGEGRVLAVRVLQAMSTSLASAAVPTAWGGAA